MVKLIVPDVNCNYYVVVNDWLLGPLAEGGIFLSDEIDITVPFGQFSEWKGIHRENGIFQIKSEGQVFANLAEISSTVLDPRWPNSRKLTTTNGIIYGTKGFALDGLSYLAPDPNDPRRMIFEGWLRPSPRRWSYYYCYFDNNTTDSTMVWSMQRLDLEFTTLQSWRALALQTSWYASSFVTSINVTADVPAFIEACISQRHITPNSGTKWYNGGKVVYTDLNISKIRDRIAANVRRAERGILTPPPVHYGDLAMKASEKINKTQINMIAFLRDLRDPTSLIPKLKNVKSIKDLSSYYLGMKYGVLPTASDLECIFGAFRRLTPHKDANGFTVYRASHFQDYVLSGDLHVSTEQRLKMAIDDEDSAFKELSSRLESIGLFPSFENLWDLVPYSFVIDWLVDVGGFLERIDTKMRLARLNIPYVTMSYKVTAKLQLDPTREAPIVGHVSAVLYHRWVSDQCPEPPLSLQLGSDPLSHWLEGGALITQRLKIK